MYVHFKFQLDSVEPVEAVYYDRLGAVMVYSFFSTLAVVSLQLITPSSLSCKSFWVRASGEGINVI